MGEFPAAVAVQPGTDGGRKAALAFGLLLLGLWMAACLWYPLTDTDIWWHLASAKWMLANRAFPRVDPFCLSSLGKPWIDLHWGFQILSQGLWTLGGAGALVAGKVFALAVSIYLALAAHLRRGNAWFLLPFAAFGIFHMRFFLDMRPLVVTLAGLSLLYLITMAWLLGRLRGPWLFLLLPIQIILANMQGLYPLGAFLVTCLLAGAWLDRKRYQGAVGGRESAEEVPLKPLALACMGLWLAGLVTPYGWKGFLLPLALLARITPVPGNVFSAEIAENQPLYTLALANPGAVLPCLALFLTVIWTFVRARSWFSSGHALLFAGFAILGFMAQRNLPLAFLAGLMAAGHNLNVSSRPLTVVHPSTSLSPLSPELPWFASPWIASLGIALTAALYSPRIRQAWSYELPGSVETPFRFPVRAADFLADHPLQGNLFNELRFGGYLAFRLYPGKLPFVDGRMILRDAEFYREFLAVVDEPSGFEGYARDRGLTHAILPIGEDRRFLPLAAHLVREEQWEVLYCDGAAVLLADASTAGSLTLPLEGLSDGHPILVSLHRRFHANPRLEAIARRNLRMFLVLAGRRNEAGMVELAPTAPRGPFPGP